MPSSTLEQRRTRARPSDWVVVVPGQQPADPADRVQPPDATNLNRFAYPHPRVPHPHTRRVSAPPLPRVALPARPATMFRQGATHLMLVVALACAVIVALGPLATSLVPSLFGPSGFVAYEGTSPENVRFVTSDGWSQMAAVPGALLLDWRDGHPDSATRLTMGNPAAEPEIERLTADGKLVEEIRYRGAWPGIDALIRITPTGWACNLVVEPGADPNAIEMEYVGATTLSIDAAGRLHSYGPSGEWIDGTPESWQDGPTGREPVDSSFKLLGGGKFGFNVGAYDPTRPLVVDPPSEQVN